MVKNQQPANENPMDNIYYIYLDDFGNDKEYCIFLICKLLNVDRKSAEEKLMNFPLKILDKGSLAEAKAIKNDFMKIKAKVRVYYDTNENTKNNSKKPIYNVKKSISDVYYENYIKPRENIEAKNTIANILIFFGVIIILIGIFFAFVVGANTRSVEIGVIIGVGSLIVGLFFVGFGEIINLLEKIKNK